MQPFISGAISKTVNMPEDLTIEDVEQLHIDAWRLGIKAVAIYRDNCKVAQPLSTAESAAIRRDDVPAVRGRGAHPSWRPGSPNSRRRWPTSSGRRTQSGRPVRERLPRKRKSMTFTFRVADCEGYVTVGEYEDGRPGEVFIKVSKQGSTLAGIMDAFAIAMSLGLQHGVPLATYVEKYANMKFEPAGITDDPDLRIASSLVDYIFRRLAVDYLSVDERAKLGVLSTQERMQPTLPGIEEQSTPTVGLVDDGLGGPGAGGGFPSLTTSMPSASAPADRSTGPGGAARRAVLLQLRQPHAAGRVLLRVRELRDDERLLVGRRSRIGDVGRRQIGGTGFRGGWPLEFAPGGVRCVSGRHDDFVPARKTTLDLALGRVTTRGSFLLGDARAAWARRTAIL